MEENVKVNHFEGKSNRGDFYEALEDAIQAAKESLKTEFVEWTLNNLSGAYGGIVGAKDLTVSIEARSPAGSVTGRSNAGGGTNREQ